MSICETYKDWSLRNRFIFDVDKQKLPRGPQPSMVLKAFMAQEDRWPAQACQPPERMMSAEWFQFTEKALASLAPTWNRIHAESPLGLNLILSDCSRVVELRPSLCQLLKSGMSKAAWAQGQQRTEALPTEWVIPPAVQQAFSMICLSQNAANNENRKLIRFLTLEPRQLGRGGASSFSLTHIKALWKAALV